MDREIHNRSHLFLASFVFSIILHFAAVLVVKYYANLTIEKSLVNPEYVMVTTYVREVSEPENFPVENKNEENMNDRTIESKEIEENVLTESSAYI